MAWARVQSAQKLQTTAVTTVTVTLGSTPTTGNKIIVGFVDSTGSSSVTISSVKDGNGNNLTSLLTGVHNTGNLFLWLYAYDVPATPSSSFTITFGASQSDISVVAQEISGLLAGNTTAMLDGTPGTTTGSHAGTGNFTAPSYTSTAANEYLLSVFGDFGNSATMACSGYTLDANSVNTNAQADCVFAYKNSTNGAETSTFNATANSGTDQYAQITVAFKIAAGGGSDLTVSVSDSASTSESVAVQMDRGLAVSDSSSTSETVAVVIPGPALQISVSDTVGNAETVAAVESSPTLAVSDTIGHTEAVTLQCPSQISVSDSTSVSESITVSPPNSTPQLNVQDSTSTSEWVVIAFDPPITFTLEVNVSDSIGSSESITLQDPSPTSVSDNVGHSETVAASMAIPPLSASDTIGSSESVNATTSNPQVAVSDSTSTSENVSVQITAIGTEQINASDTIGHAENVHVSVSAPPDSLVAVSDHTAVNENAVVQLLPAGNPPNTHPPLGGTFNAGSSGGTPNNGSGAGVFSNPTSGGTVTFKQLGGTPQNTSHGGTVQIPIRSGNVVIPDAGGDIE